MEITKTVTVEVSAKDWVDGLKDYDIPELLVAVAHKFDQNFVKRRDCAIAFADHLSEQGARFLAEVIAAHHARDKESRR